MSNKHKIQILSDHSIQYRLQGHLLFAESVYCLHGVSSSNWVLVSDWSNNKLLTWLGY